MNGTPFAVVPWHKPFLPALIDIALERTGGDLGRACFIFPHARPARYMLDLIRQDERIPKPCIMPRMEPVSTLFSLARGGIGGERGTTAVGLLDQVALLLRCVRETRQERQQQNGPLRALPLEDTRFFPWGVRLAALMEELFLHNRVPEDYHNMEGQVAPFAAALLGNLGTLHTRYTQALTAESWTTPGYDAFITAQAISRGEYPALPGIDGKMIFLAGFHTLSGSQELFFKHLWQQRGATVVLHADPRVIPTHASDAAKHSPHWSCEHLVRWAFSWHADLVPARPGDEATEDLPRPEIRFKAGFDVHSQLGELSRDMAGDAPRPGSSGTAVVLPDTGLLMPVLHHMPDTDINISMGYPLGRSPLFRLIETILTLQETRRGTGPYTYHWKSLIALLRHPYFKMLSPEPVADGEEDTASSAAPLTARSFRRFLHVAEQAVRTGRRFAAVDTLPETTAASVTEDTGRGASRANAQDAATHARFLRAILDTALHAWEEVNSPAAMAAALDKLATLLRAHGQHLWAHHPVDAECLYRLSQSVIPQLAHTALAEEHLTRETLFSVLRKLLAGERVPFEAYPLVGVQVMGMLETRLLQFDKLRVLDVTEDRLPGTPGHDPLLPDSLRPVMGLPGKRGRERLIAYTFFRLLAGAKDVILYWQEGVETQGLADGKKVRSRFVEELLWREEQRLGRVLSPEKAENGGMDGPLELVSCVLPSVTRERRVIPASPAARKRMDVILSGGISPSLMNTYLQCPAKFFYERIGRIRETEGVTEGRDPLGTGLFIHAVLQRYFATRLDTPLTVTDANLADLAAIFREELAASERLASLPADERIMLEEAGPHILETMLRAQEGRVPRFIEEPLHAVIDVDGKKRTLAGTADRIDETPGGMMVLDYKTGYVSPVDAELWEDHAFWEALDTWRPEDGSGEEQLAMVAEALASVQMPAYLYMLAYGKGVDAHDAVYVPMRSGAAEVPLLGDEMDEDDRDAVLHERIPVLLRFLLRHMAGAERFAPRESANCNWCSCRNMCMIAPSESL